MLMFYKLIFSFFLLSGLFSFVIKRKYLLCTLLSLEFLVLSIYFLMFFILICGFYNLYFIMYFLTFSVCEGALGLSVLVCMIRTHGADYFGCFNLVQC